MDDTLRSLLEKERDELKVRIAAIEVLLGNPTRTTKPIEVVQHEDPPQHMTREGPKPTPEKEVEAQPLGKGVLEMPRPIPGGAVQYDIPKAYSLWRETNPRLPQGKVAATIAAAVGSSTAAVLYWKRKYRWGPHGDLWKAVPTTTPSNAGTAKS